MKIRLLSFFIAGLTFLIFANSAMAGLGLSPSRWIEPDALRKSHLEKIFTLSRSSPDQDLSFKVSLEGETKNWIKLDKGLKFVMPKGSQQFPLKIILDIPSNAKYKNYQGEIRLSSQSGRGKEGVGINVSSLIQIDLTVSDKKVSNYEILQISIPDFPEGKPASIHLKVINRGNIEAKPTKVTVQFLDKYRSQKLSSSEIVNISSSPVPSFSEGEIIIETPFNFKQEQYWAEVKVYQDKTVLKAESITFNLLHGGFLSGSARIKSLVNLTMLIAVFAIGRALLSGRFLLNKRKRFKFIYSLKEKIFESTKKTIQKFRSPK